MKLDFLDILSPLQEHFSLTNLCIFETVKAISSRLWDAFETVALSQHRLNAVSRCLKVSKWYPFWLRYIWLSQVYPFVSILICEWLALILGLVIFQRWECQTFWFVKLVLLLHTSLTEDIYSVVSNLVSSCLKSHIQLSQILYPAVSTHISSCLKPYIQSSQIEYPVVSNHISSCLKSYIQLSQVMYPAVSDHISSCLKSYIQLSQIIYPAVSKQISSCLKSNIQLSQIIYRVVRLCTWVSFDWRQWENNSWS